jgi:ABC-2 type transport system permease protein
MSRGEGSVLRSELTKLLTLRSVQVALVLTVVLPVLAAALSAPAVGQGIASDDPALAAGVTPESVGLEWVVLGQIGMIVVGVLAASSEHVAGQLRVSVVAVPARGRLLVAKAVALLLVTVGVGIVAVPALSLLSQLGLGGIGVIGDGIPASLVWRWVGAIAFWAGMAQVGLALAVLLRQALVPIFVLIAVSQLSLMLVVMTTWSKLLPTVAGVQLFDPGSINVSFPDAALTPGQAYACLGLWVAGLLDLAGALFLRRDVRA